MEQENLQERPDFEALLRSDKAYQSACDKKVAQALTTARTKWERERQAEEAQRQAALETELEQRLSEERSVLDRQRREFEHRMRQVAVAGALQQRGLDAAFAPWLTGETEQDCEERVEQFTQLFQTALSQAVAGRMRGAEPPRRSQPLQELNREQLRGMSAKEINRQWERISEALKR